jgi:hypothetical protein
MKCKTDGCDNEAVGHRGTCRDCHHTAFDAVDRGFVTWKQLEDSGIVNCPDTPLLQPYSDDIAPRRSGGYIMWNGKRNVKSEPMYYVIREFLDKYLGETTC